MALLVSKTINSLGGIDIPQIYIRLHYSVGFEGKRVDVNSQIYISRDAYLQKIRENVFTLPQIPESLSFKYDRLTDSADILVFIHKKFKEILSTDQLYDSPILDPSTGSEQYNPSTGRLLTESKVSVPKFAESKEITIVDID